MGDPSRRVRGHIWQWLPLALSAKPGRNDCRPPRPGQDHQRKPVQLLADQLAIPWFTVSPVPEARCLFAGCADEDDSAGCLVGDGGENAWVIYPDGTRNWVQYAGCTAGCFTKGKPIPATALDIPKRRSGSGL